MPPERSDPGFALTSRADIQNLLRARGVPLTLEQIAEHCHHQQSSQARALHGRLQAMVRDGQLALNRSGAYGLPAKMALVQGVVSAGGREDFGVLLGEDGEQYQLARNQMRYLLPSDVIVARLGTHDKLSARRYASWVEFIQRPSVVGRARLLGNTVFVRPLKRNLPELWIAKPPPDLQHDELVQAQIALEYSDPPRASVGARYRQRSEAQQEARIALANNGIELDFPPELLASTERISARLSAAERARREDLSALPFCTIDGGDAQDYDDAIYAEGAERRGYRLLVAIADVAHYVKAGSELDLCAQGRGTSVYFPNLVAPMLPTRLSNDLCSLVPEQERLVLAVELRLDSKAELQSWRFVNGVIRSQARLEYLQVQAAADSGEFGAIPAAVQGSLQVLWQIYHKREILRTKRGSLEIDSYSTEFSFDEQGSVSAIDKGRRVAAHKLIEEMMLLANEAAARCLHVNRVPGLYRIHPEPEAEASAALLKFLRGQGVKIGNGKLSSPQQYARLAQKLALLPQAEQLQLALLRSLNQARYAPEPSLHFGLNYDFYTHFTSPIRRYPDLVVHRQLKAAIAKAGDELDSGQYYQLQINKPSRKKLQGLAQMQSFLERRAESASREAADVLKCLYLRARVGDCFSGHVTQVTSFGLFVALTDLPIDGLVHISSLGNDYYRYDPAHQCLRASRSGQLYGLGMALEVQLIRVDVDKRRIDLRLA